MGSIFVYNVNIQRIKPVQIQHDLFADVFHKRLFGKPPNWESHVQAICDINKAQLNFYIDF